MDKKEIKKEIQELEKELEKETKNSMPTFVYNPKIGMYAEKIRLLKVTCGKGGHEFKNGKCIWCGEEE